MLLPNFKSGSGRMTICCYISIKTKFINSCFSIKSFRIRLSNNLPYLGLARNPKPRFPVLFLLADKSLGSASCVAKIAVFALERLKPRNEKSQ